VITMKPGFIILAVTYDGITPAKYSDRDLCDEDPIFDTEELARAEVQGIADQYHRRGRVPVLVIAPCFKRA